MTLVLAALVALVLKGVGSTRAQAEQGLIIAVQEGLGAGCPFGGNYGPTEVVGNLASFLNSRSGIVLSQAVKNRLITLETQTMYGGRRRKTAGDINTAVSATWLERVGQLTDAQIYQVGYCTRTAVDVPLELSPGVMARASGETVADSMEGWMSVARAYRDASTPEAMDARAATPGAIGQVLDQRLQLYREALPDQWNPTTGYTPAQAFLIGYAVVTDDWLHQSPAALTQAMEALEAAIHESFPNVATSCDNRMPYGYMGYLYSTHTPHLFNETVQNRLLDRL